MLKALKESCKGKYAVITGASRGLGKSFSIQLARCGINPILISSNDQISALCTELRDTYHVDCQYIVADLTKRDSLFSVAEEINRKYPVFFLINNAGIGGSRCFEEVGEEYVEKILDLNVKATAIITKLLIDNLLRQEKSYVLNVASMAALTPIGYKMVYPASKAFIYNFSLSLRAEYRKRGLSVSVVCPGAMATSPDIIARIQKQGHLGKLTLVSTENVAKKCVIETLLGKREILVNPIGHFFSKITPINIKTPILTRIVKRETIK